VRPKGWTAYRWLAGMAEFVRHAQLLRLPLTVPAC
jgi:hypothetical protein